MSFKYRFILSFVFLQAFFIILVVMMNFYTITNSSNKLIQNKINSNIVFLDKLIRVPISVFDLATLDAVVQSTYNLSFVNTIVIVDDQGGVLSEKYDFKYMDLKEFLALKKNGKLEYDGISYDARYKEIIDGDLKFGAIYLLYDNSENAKFIQKNKMNNIYVILIEILIATLLSYIIGKRITQRLEGLASTAILIGENKDVIIEHQDSTDEIGALSRAMHQMREDIKERREKLKNITEELRLQKRELIQASQAKDDFLANMSHELKTPLNSINLISSVMMKNKQNKLDEDQVKNLRIINSCGNDLLFLINDVLDISKIEAGQLDINSFEFDLKNTLNQLVDMFEPLANEKNLTLEYKIDDSIQFIKSDENRVKQIVKNLLSNSMKFTKQGKIRLVVNQQNSFIRILVQDDGIGIAKEKLETIFDRFKQADSSTTRKFGGTGLGLAISKELSIMLGGDIQVKSKENKGTAFLVTIRKDLIAEKVQKEKTDTDILKEPTQAPSGYDMEMDLFEHEEELVDEGISKVALFNNNPSIFFPLIVALKKFDDIEFMQITDLEKLEDELKFMEANVLIFDGDIKDENLNKIIDNSKLFTISIADNIQYENISRVFVKPINIDEIKETIIKRS